MVRLRDSGDDDRNDGSDGAPAHDGNGGTQPSPAEVVPASDAELADAGDEIDDPVERARAIARVARSDPETAGDFVGELIESAQTLRGEDLDPVDAALDEIGRSRPVEFEVWTDRLAQLAAAGDTRAAFLGLRSFAQLAAINPRAAEVGLDHAADNLTAPDEALRRAALAVVAEVGPENPDAVRHTDRQIATALADDAATIRVGGAITAGRLLRAGPTGFPRSASALVDALDDDDERVRQFAHIGLIHFARDHATNVPDKETAIRALAAITDEELGVHRGASDEALSALLTVELGYEVDLR